MLQRSEVDRLCALIRMRYSLTDAAKRLRIPVRRLWGAYNAGKAPDAPQGPRYAYESLRAALGHPAEHDRTGRMRQGRQVRAAISADHARSFHAKQRIRKQSRRLTNKVTKGD